MALHTGQPFDHSNRVNGSFGAPHPRPPGRLF